MTDFPETATK